MIWYYLLLFIGSLLTAAFSWVPKVTELPLGMDDVLVMSVGYFRAVLDMLPWLAYLWSMLLWYLGFRILFVDSSFDANTPCWYIGLDV